MDDKTHDERLDAEKEFESNKQAIIESILDCFEYDENIGDVERQKERDLKTVSDAVHNAWHESITLTDWENSVRRRWGINPLGYSLLLIAQQNRLLIAQQNRDEAAAT